MQFHGVYTALVTPFRQGAVDEEGLRAHVEWQIEQGVHGLVPCGTTGESATLSHEEHEDVIRICVEQCKKRVPVIAGAGSNNTKEAIRLTRYAKKAGADGALLITPYYNKPPQEGLYQHYKAIAAEVSFPMIVYNVPGRTCCNILPETLARLVRDVPEVIGVKEATANLAQISEVLEYCGRDFQVLSGDDFTVLPILSIGGCGVISVSSNVAPARMAALYNAFVKGDYAAAQETHYSLSPLNRAMFWDTNPIPAKAALALMGHMSAEMRLPLSDLKPELAAKLKTVLEQNGLL